MLSWCLQNPILTFFVLCGVGTFAQTVVKAVTYKRILTLKAENRRLRLIAQSKADHEERLQVLEDAITSTDRDFDSRLLEAENRNRGERQ